MSGLSLSGPDAGNYVISPFPSTTASITPAPLIVTANPATMTYGGTLPALTDTVSGLVGSDTVGSALTGSLATTATSSSPAGNYPITLGTLAAVDGNYLITFNGANLSITPAHLTITANDASKVYGAPIPVLTASYSGFVNGDTVASLASPASLTTSATSSSPVGAYAINVGGASSSNYTITYVPGTLTITKASSSVASSVSVSTVVVGQTDTFTAAGRPGQPRRGPADGAGHVPGRRDADRHGPGRSRHRPGLVQHVIARAWFVRGHGDLYGGFRTSSPVDLPPVRSWSRPRARSRS